MTSTVKHILTLGVLTLLILGCGHSETENGSAQNDTIKLTKDEINDQKSNFFSTDLIYNVNGMSALDTFDIKKYIRVLGQPDSIKRGGAAIIEEFGYDDYNLWYGKNWINAGHGHILTACIKETGISFNGIQVGDKQTKIETTFNIPHSEKDTIEVVNKNDDALTFYLDNKVIRCISFWRPL